MNYADSDISKHVIAELAWEPSMRDDDVAVGARDGVVTLTGAVDSFADRWKAERVAARVKGVKGIVNNIEVKLPSSSERPDPEITRAAQDALKWNITVPHDRIKVKVDKGWVTFEGDVTSYFQKEAAERTVRTLTGVRGVSNLITVRVGPAPTDVKNKIKEALKRGAEFDAERITVDIEGGAAILRGSVGSYFEMRDAERSVRNAPGVKDVKNLLVVDPSMYAQV